MKDRAYLIFLGLCSVACFFSFMNAAFALILGIIVAVTFKKSYNLEKINGLLLKFSIILLGFGINWKEALLASKSGLFLTSFTIVFTLFIGIMIGRFLKLNFKTTLLISIGTAICGGSAIAAVSPIIRPKNDQFTISMLIIFSLNAISLLIFPYAGKLLNLSQTEFGTWVAVSIHDTSSVVGAASIYGNEAMEVATTMKLTRALWIVPTTICLSIINANKTAFNYLKLPWFILFFILTMLISNSLPALSAEFDFLSGLGAKCLILALFFVGTSFDPNKIKKIGTKSLLLGLTLWIIISVVSLLLIN